jgi:hypothetical protein
MRAEIGAMLGLDAPAPPKRTKAAPPTSRPREAETEATVRPSSRR